MVKNTLSIKENGFLIFPFTIEQELSLSFQLVFNFSLNFVLRVSYFRKNTILIFKYFVYLDEFYSLIPD
jgi:hypothetical protein